MSVQTDWYRDRFLVSSNPSLIQPDAVNAAFASDILYWCKPIQDRKVLKEMLDNSLCFGVYELPETTSNIAGLTNPRQIGFARVITDKFTFAYLTDVYILSEYQGKGLGSWLLKCLDETFSTWPELRRVLLLTSGQLGQKLYSEKLGMKNFEGGEKGLVVMTKGGAGSVLDL